MNAIRQVAFGVIVSTALVGCGSKPSESDIKKGLEIAYECKLFSVDDVKKTNGIEKNEKNLYDVEFSYRIKVNGDAEKLFTKLAELRRTAKEYDTEANRVFDSDVVGNTPSPASGQENNPEYIEKAERFRSAQAQVDELRAKSKAIEEETNSFYDGCTLRSVKTLAFMQDDYYQQNASSPEKPVIPTAGLVDGKATMIKTEQGWQMMDNLKTSIQEFVHD